MEQTKIIKNENYVYNFCKIKKYSLCKSIRKRVIKQDLDFYEKHKDTIWEIYYAYTNSRYGDKEYPKELVEKFLKALEEFYQLVQKWL